ncbi:MAG: hypothetical protein ACLFQV_09810 [Vulcanimicrobiota bacterium]
MKDKNYLQFDNLFVVPVCHYQAEFAYYVAEAVRELKPDLIAVELPSTLQSHLVRAVKRFPFYSVVFYRNGDGDYIYFPVEPSDPLAEAIRSGLEMDIPVKCVDYDADDYPLIFDPMPDPYSVQKLGLVNYYNLYKDTVESGQKPNPITPRDEMREETMAYRIQQHLQQEEKVLLVCGITHVEGIIRRLKRKCVLPLGKATRKDLQIFNLSLNSIREVAGEDPFISAIYEMNRGAHRIEQEIDEISREKIEREKNKYRDDSQKVLSLQDFRKKSCKPSKFNPAESTRNENYNNETGLAKKEYKYLRHKKKQNTESVQLSYEIPMIFELESHGENQPPLLQKTNNYHTNITASNKDSKENKQIFNSFMKKIVARLFNMPEKSTAGRKTTIAEEKEYFELFFKNMNQDRKAKKEKIHKFQGCEDRWKELLQYYRQIVENENFRDRQRLLILMLKKAASHYKENVNEEISPWQLRVFMNFARKYARVTGRLLPDLYQMIIAARSCSDDNYAYEVWDLLTCYPWLDNSGKIQTVDIKADEVWLNGKKITLRRKFPYFRKQLMRIPVNRRLNEKNPGDWAKEFDEAMLCSYPPEDLVIENFSGYLQKKGMNILSEEHSRIQPFTTSLLDGVDIKETLRNWHEKKIYVKEKLQRTGGVGSVVIIFDDDTEDRKFNWQLTWLGEHHQESDMAFYSTHPADKIVGPGIARCTYGGFMMTYPPGRVWDVWTDPFYTQAKNKSEVLLMSAIEYSQEKNIVYAAAKPPRSYFKTFASRLGKQIIYIPIGSLSPVTLKKIRVFHVLSGHKVRDIARQYIW